MVDPGEHRIGDSERQQAIDVLRAHTGAGRLTLDEFADLAGQVYAAQTYRQLDDVARNLPAGLVAGASDPAAGPPAAGSPLAGAASPGSSAARPAASVGKRRRRFVAIMSGSMARGRWRAPSEITAFAFWGGVNVDLRTAEPEAPVIDIVAWAVMGGVTVTVAEGTRVELDGCVLMGGSTDFTRAAEPPPGSPLVRVHARGLWGGVSVISRKTKAQRAAAAAADPDGRGVDRQADLGIPDMLELPRHVLDDLATRLPDLMDHRAREHVESGRHGHGRRSSRRRSRGWAETDAPAAPAPTPPTPGPPAPTPAAPPAAPAPTSRPASTPPSEPVTSADPATSAERAAPSTRANGDRPVSTPSGTLTMMVTDIVESTALVERLGDHGWIGVLADHNALVREVVARHDGTEIKAQGDGFLLVFTSARRAILAAAEVQRAMARYGVEHPETPVSVRIGLHTGEIVGVDGDVLGQNVVVAARIADQAQPGEIVVSALTRDITVSGGDLRFGPAVEVTLKGLSQPWRVHRVEWSTEPA